jgi:hypothetical protein
MRPKWLVAPGVVLTASLGAFLALAPHRNSPKDSGPTSDATPDYDATADASEPDAASSSEDSDPFAIDEDASAEIRLPGWPGWPLPKGTTVTPAVFCEGAIAASLFVRNPKCSVAETRADLERNKRKPFAGFGNVMARSKAAHCIARVTASIEKRRVRLDPEAGERCIAAGIDLAFDVVAGPIDTAECNGYLIGLQNEGQSCTDPWECIDGLACVGFTNTKDGRCKSLPQLGAPCGNGEPDRNMPFDIGERPACAKGARCYPWGGRCRRAQKKGERCDEDWDCLEELACRAHKCASKDRVAVGGTCLHIADCAPTLYCAGTDYLEKSGVCTPKKAAGESCNDDSECKGHCEFDARTRKRFCMAWCQSG